MLVMMDFGVSSAFQFWTKAAGADLPPDQFLEELLVGLQGDDMNYTRSSTCIGHMSLTCELYLYTNVAKHVHGSGTRHSQLLTIV